MYKNPHVAWKCSTRRVINEGVIPERCASRAVERKELPLFLPKRNYRRSLSSKRLYTSIQAISFWPASPACLSARASFLPFISSSSRLDSVLLAQDPGERSLSLDTQDYAEKRDARSCAPSVYSNRRRDKNRDKTVRARARIESVLRLSRLVLSASTINRSFRNRSFVPSVRFIACRDRAQHGINSVWNSDWLSLVSFLSFFPFCDCVLTACFC